MDLHCFNIDYFPREEYSPDPNDSTMAIPCKYQIPLPFEVVQGVKNNVQPLIYLRGSSVLENGRINTKRVNQT
jgi:hypothetical protein